jgi:nucleotide-binding universal stress UspA family protein
MFKSILVPVDGSRFAEGALPIARRIVELVHGRLHLVLVHEPVAAFAGMGEMIAPPPDLDTEFRQQELRYLTETVEEIGALGSAEVTFSNPNGPAGEAIAALAESRHADLVVMATHGRGTLGRLWLGSVADFVVRHLSIPVLLVHPDRTGQKRPPVRFRGIMVPVDFSPASEAILEPAGQLALATQAHVTLLHVIEPFYMVGEPTVPYPVPQDPTITEIRRSDAQRRLDDLADRMRQRGIGVSTRVVIGSNAAGGILSALDEAPYDLVAIATQGHGGVRRLLLGSVADKVIRGAEKPVMILRPPGGERR